MIGDRRSAALVSVAAFDRETLCVVGGCRVSPTEGVGGAYEALSHAVQPSHSYLRARY